MLSIQPYLSPPLQIKFQLVSVIKGSGVGLKIKIIDLVLVFFLATLVALHLTPVRKRASDSFGLA